MSEELANHVVIKCIQTAREFADKEKVKNMNGPEALRFFAQCLEQALMEEGVK